MQKTLRKLSQRNETYIAIVLFVLFLLIEVRSKQFFTPNNIVDILSAMVVSGIFAIGTFMVIISGGIDVSFPALASLSSYAITKLLLDADYQGGIWLPILMAIVFGGVLGAFNGFFIGHLGLPALIVTLGSASVFKGFMQGTLKSVQLAVIPPGMKDFGTSALFVATNAESGLTSRMHSSILVFIVLLIVAWFILRRTMFGRGIYAIGGNPVSALRAGFSVKWTKFWLYVFVGVVSSLAGLMRTCMMTQMHPTNMLGMEMNIIAGVVLGGTAITGGAGTLTGCMLGTLLIVVVENSMILIGVPTVWKSVFVGALIIIGIGVSAMQVYRANSIHRNRKLSREVG